MIVRALSAVVATLLLTGFLPLTSQFGFCAAKPCCRNQRSSTASITTHPVCCNETNCATPTRDNEATATRGAHVQPQFVAIPMTVSLALPAHAGRRETLSFESPPTSRRLATLSVLLV